MPMDYLFDPRGFLLVRVEGTPSYEEMTASVSGYRSDPRFEPGLPILVDDRGRDQSPSTDEIQRLARGTDGLGDITGGHRCALLVNRDVQFGMSRMYAALVDEKAVEASVFRDEAEAIAWLLRGDGDD